MQSVFYVVNPKICFIEYFRIKFDINMQRVIYRVSLRGYKYTGWDCILQMKMSVKKESYICFDFSLYFLQPFQVVKAVYVVPDAAFAAYG